MAKNKLKEVYNVDLFNTVIAASNKLTQELMNRDTDRIVDMFVNREKGNAAPKHNWDAEGF